MALWLVRAGSRGQDEHKFLTESRVYLCWARLARDLAAVKTRAELRSILAETYPNAKPGRRTQNSGQIWAFAKRINPGDWIVLPSKFAPSVHIGEVTGGYTFVPDAEDPYHHYREVNWIEQDVPRTSFDQDILYSMGAFLTICEIKRNDAEARVRAMALNNWKATRVASVVSPNVSHDPEVSDDEDTEDIGTDIDLEVLARDQLTRHIYAKFKGHPLASLVGEVLRAQGYTVYQPPEGPDRGIDLLAAPGALGFGSPKICVQVKSQDTPLDRPTLDQLLGTMSNVQADRGLLVCWGGFKNTVRREEAQQFFRVRMWDSDDLIDQILQTYDRLSPTTQAEIPLKQVWMIASPDDE